MVGAEVVAPEWQSRAALVAAPWNLAKLGRGLVCVVQAMSRSEYPELPARVAVRRRLEVSLASSVAVVVVPMVLPALQPSPEADQSTGAEVVVPAATSAAATKCFPLLLVAARGSTCGRPRRRVAAVAQLALQAPRAQAAARHLPPICFPWAAKVAVAVARTTRAQVAPVAMVLPLVALVVGAAVAPASVALEAPVLAARSG